MGALTMLLDENISVRVARVLVEALNVDEDDLRPTATLQGDLGAESIDFLDIVFRLEREFGLKIPRGELFPESIFQGDPDFVRDGRVTDRGMAELRARMPYADLAGFEQDRRLGAIPDLFTVGLLTRYLAWKLSPPAHDRAIHAGGYITPPEGSVSTVVAKGTSS
jgi:acyl carrier protein